MICPRCKYEWNTRIEYPKECPRCKKRLDKYQKTYIFNSKKAV